MVALLPSRKRIVNNQIQIRYWIPFINRTINPGEIVAVRFENKVSRVVELEEEYFHADSLPSNELEEFAQKNHLPITYKTKRGKTKATNTTTADNWPSSPHSLSAVGTIAWVFVPLYTIE